MRLHRDPVVRSENREIKAVMIVTREAEDAWCPPTFKPS
jgi:hypothetical protein